MILEGEADEVQCGDVAKVVSPIARESEARVVVEKMWRGGRFAGPDEVRRTRLRQDDEIRKSLCLGYY